MSRALPARPQCEAYRKPGSFMTFGPRVWVQCENPCDMLVTFEEKDVKGVVTSRKVWTCNGCYSEFLTRQPDTPHKVSHKRVVDKKLKVLDRRRHRSV
jgi:hypothetical protein